MGSGDDPSFQINVDSMNSTLQNFCSRISPQNQIQNKTLNECLMGTNSMLRECLARDTNVVRENSTSVSQCLKGMARMLEERYLKPSIVG